MNTEIKTARRQVGFARGVGPQRYAHSDPAPHIPFQEDYITIDRRDKAVVWVITIAAMMLLVLDIVEVLK